MDLREAVQQAIKQKAAAQPEPAPRPVTANEVNTVEASGEEEAIGELVVAEYVIFLLALDTYLRYLAEGNLADDDVIALGIRLLRAADADLTQIELFFREHLPSDTHRKMLSKYVAIRAVTPEGIGRRALGIRTVLNRGGATTMRGVFVTNRALKQVREATSAAMLDNADAALDLFAKIPFRNARLRAWIDLAAKTAVSGIGTPANVVEQGSKEAQDSTTELLTQSIQQIASDGAEASRAAGEAQTDRLQQVQDEATIAARQAMDRAGELDEPLTKSETIGVAVAAATAAMTDPSNPQNIPETLRGLDDEQRAAALTDGRVAVFAGAGSGKSTTLVARTGYLVRDRRSNPSRMLVTSFNTKASNQLKVQIGRVAGGEALRQMSVGTMHSLFRRFIMEFGTGDERGSMQDGFIGDGTKPVGYAVQKVWEECFKKDNRPVPKLKMALLAKAKWSGNNIGPTDAQAMAQTQDEADAALWYEIYEGMKAGNWKPPCPSRTYEAFMGRHRPNGRKLGDFTDMLKVFRDILARDAVVRKKIQGMFDHIIVDEAQDRNTIMSDIIDMMSEHITDGGDGKSVWIVGDDKQAINSFQGAKSSIFKALYQKEGWKTRVIRTNYRCEPEIVDAGNALIAHNEDNVPVPQVPAPTRKRGVGSVQVHATIDEVDAALIAIQEVKQNHVLGEDYTDHAVLCRTNKELHAFETACIIRGVPYARKGASSFLGSPETKAVLGYVQLVTGTDFTKGQQALGAVINTPNRFFLADPKKAPDAVEAAFRDYARVIDADVKTIDPGKAMLNRTFQGILAQQLARYTRTGKGFKFEAKIDDLAYEVSEMKAKSKDPDYTTANLFDEILSLKGVTNDNGEFVPQTFRESLTQFVRDSLDDDDDAGANDEDEADPTKGLGNVSFLYQIAKPDPTDEEDSNTPPTTPSGFAAKIARYASKMRDLRTDVTAWEREQDALPPEQRRPPPGVYVGTVHSVKGAQWKTCFVQMPAGKFPMKMRAKPGEEPLPPEVAKEQLADERQLGYVALTRAAKNLRILCPTRVGGKPGGISQFVDEAGLNLGENVVTEAGVVPPATIPEQTDESLETGPGEEDAIPSPEPEGDTEWIPEPGEL